MTAVAQREALVQYLLRLEDNCLILGHRLSNGVARGRCWKRILLFPISRSILPASPCSGLIWRRRWRMLAGTLMPWPSSATFWIGEIFCTGEQPNGDFAQTIVRQFLFDCFHVELLQSLTKSANQEIANIAAEAIKEAVYHRRHSGQWVIRRRRDRRKPEAGAGRARATLGLYARAFRRRCYRRDDDAGRNCG